MAKPIRYRNVGCASPGCQWGPVAELVYTDGTSERLCRWCTELARRLDDKLIVSVTPLGSLN